MNSVDTGWINDEKPVAMAHAHAQKQAWQTPIDEVDAAARLLDTVFSWIEDVHGERLAEQLVPETPEQESANTKHGARHGGQGGVGKEKTGSNGLKADVGPGGGQHMPAAARGGAGGGRYKRPGLTKPPFGKFLKDYDLTEW